MKKQIWAGIFAGIMIAGMSFTAYAGQWESDSTGYWYREDDGSYPSDVWKMIDGKWYHFNEQGYMESDTWIGDYYVGTDGALWTNTLTKEGYWLDGSGKKDENKRIYGDCVFSPTSYRKEGDRFEITGVICDTGCMAQEDIDRMSAGTVIKIPDIYQFDRVCEFTEEARVAEFYENHSFFYEDAFGGRKTMVVKEPFYYQDLDGKHVGECEYYLNSKAMGKWSTGSMDTPVYRVLQRGVMLIADNNTNFVAEDNFYETSLEECLVNWGSTSDNVLKVILSGNHIDQAINLSVNHSG